MPGKSFTPVSIKRRSAAHGFVNAHRATPDHRGLVEAVFDGVESTSVSSKLGMFVHVRDYRVKNSFECSLSHLCNTW